LSFPDFDGTLSHYKDFLPYRGEDRSADGRVVRDVGLERAGIFEGLEAMAAAD